MTNKFLSVLKTIGEVVANGITTYAGVGPIFKTSAAPSSVITTATEIDAIAQAAIQVEAIGKNANLTGPQKLSALTPMVFAILQNALNLGHDPMANPALCEQGAQEISQGMVDFLNGLKAPASATSPSGTAMPSTAVATVAAPTPAAPTV